MTPHTHQLATQLADHLVVQSAGQGGAQPGGPLGEHAGSVLLLVLLVLPGLVLLLRGTGGRLWPYRPCRHCDGTGRARGRLGIGVRPCPRCHATGIRSRRRTGATGPHTRSHDPAADRSTTGDHRGVARRRTR